MIGKRKASRNKKCRIGKWIQDRRKKKQRLSLMKKPSLRKIFAKYMAAGLCAAVIVGYMGTQIAVANYRAAGQMDFRVFTKEMGEDIAQSYTESVQIARTQDNIMSLWKAQVRLLLNTRREYGYEACLYDVDTKERFMEQKCVVNITIVEKPESEEPIFRSFECEWAKMQEALSDYNELFPDSGAEVDETYIEEWPDLEIKDIYIKGGAFVPGKVRLVMTNKAGTTKVLKEYDYTPDDITGYQHLDSKEMDKYGTKIFWCIEPTEEVDYKVIDAYMKSEEYDWNEKYFWRREESVYRNTFWGTEEFFTEQVTLDNGKDYLLFVAVDMNMWNDFKNRILAAYGGLLLLALLAATSAAYVSYMKRLGYYRLDAYRRETTNAMAHDLKTPLMAIFGYAENLRNNVHTEKKDYYADLIVEHVKYMNDMVENILELAKVEGVSRVSEKIPVDLKIQTETILKKYEILITDKNLKVNMEGECEIEADKVCMEQAIENLIGNALKYALKDTDINIRMDKHVYEIKNRMGAKLQTPADELWKPFVKGDESRNEQRGTGIGLTIVKNIVDMHGFELMLQCENQEFVAGILF